MQYIYNRLRLSSLEEKEKLSEAKEEEETNRGGGKVASHEEGGLQVEG